MFPLFFPSLVFDSCRHHITILFFFPFRLDEVHMLMDCTVMSGRKVLSEVILWLFFTVVLVKTHMSLHLYNAPHAAALF